MRKPIHPNTEESVSRTCVREQHTYSCRPPYIRTLMSDICQFREDALIQTVTLLSCLLVNIRLYQQPLVCLSDSPALTGAHYLITHHPQVHQGFWQAVTVLVYMTYNTPMRSHHPWKNTHTHTHKVFMLAGALRSWGWDHTNEHSRQLLLIFGNIWLNCSTCLTRLMSPRARSTLKEFGGNQPVG